MVLVPVLVPGAVAVDVDEDDHMFVSAETKIFGRLGCCFFWARALGFRSRQV